MTLGNKDTQEAGPREHLEAGTCTISLHQPASSAWEVRDKEHAARREPGIQESRLVSSASRAANPELENACTEDGILVRLADLQRDLQPCFAEQQELDASSTKRSRE